MLVCQTIYQPPLLVWPFQVAPELDLFTLDSLDPQDVTSASNKAILCTGFSPEI